MDFRAGFPEASRRPRDHPDDIGFPGPDVDVPGHHPVRKRQLAFGFFHQVQNLFRAFAQDHPLLGQGDPAGARRPPDHQPLSQLLLQILQLDGKGRLRKVQRLRRRGDALFPCHREKIL